MSRVKFDTSSVPDWAILTDWARLEILQNTVSELYEDRDAQRLRADTADGALQVVNQTLAKFADDLQVAEQRIAELEADKARIDFWQANAQYAGGFAPSGDWSFFSRELNTCYGKDLRAALDRLQVMHAALNPNPEAESHEQARLERCAGVGKLVGTR